MRINFQKPPSIVRAGCFLTTGTCSKLGHRLRPEYVEPGRPEIIKNILVVDDDSCFLRLAKEILESLGFKVFLIHPDKPIKKQVFNLVSKRNLHLIILGGRERILEISGETLTKELRDKGFAGYIAANSLMPEEQEKMKSAGADFKISERGIRKFFEGAIVEGKFTSGEK